MYKFKRIHVPGFTLVESRPSSGDDHVKRFMPGTTPQNQNTLNLYLAGEFLFAIPSIGLAQTMLPGQTNLDLGDALFPVGVDAVETAVGDGCWRMCLSPQDKTARWTRRIDEIEAGGTLSLAAGDVAVVLLGEAESSVDALPVGSVISATDDMAITSFAGARVAVARIL